MPEIVNPTLKATLGILLIFVGLAGMVLPVLPGWWVVLVGLHLLGWRLVIKRHQPWNFRFRREQKTRPKTSSRSKK